MKKVLSLIVLIMLVSMLTAGSAFADAMVINSDEHAADYYVTVSAPDGGCNFRYGPGVEYGQIIANMIPNGTELHVTREASASNGNPWGFVEYGGNWGWIALSQVSVTSRPSSGSSAPAVSSSATRASYDVRVAASDGGCNIRYGAGVSYDRLMNNMIPNGAVLHIYWEETNSSGVTWGFTTYNNMNGWIALTEVVTENASSTVSNVNYRIKAAAPDGGINLRSGAGVEYGVLLDHLIPNGTVLSITRETRAASNSRFWGYTTYEGKTGWVTLEEVTPVAEVMTSSTSSQATTAGGAVGKAEIFEDEGPDGEQSGKMLTASARTGFLRPGFVLQLILTAAVVAGFASGAACFLRRRHMAGDEEPRHGENT